MSFYSLSLKKSERVKNRRVDLLSTKDKKEKDMLIDWARLAVSIAAGLIVLLVYYWILGFVARKLEKPVMWLFNRWWKPKHEVLVTPASRLEMVVKQNKKATVWWKMAGLAVGIPFLLGSLYILVLAVAPAFQAVFFPNSPEIFSNYLSLSEWIAFVVISVVLAFTYWLVEWIRQNRILVVLTDETYYAYALPTWLGFLPFFPSKRAYVSSGPTYLFEEKLWAADVEDLGGQRTSALRDRWTEYLSAEEERVGSIFLPSRVAGAADRVAWVSQYHGTALCLSALGQASYNRRLRLDTMERAETAALLGPSDEEWTEEAALERAAEIRQRRDKIYPPSDEFVDLFACEDPGLWNRRKGIPVQKRREQEANTVSRVRKLFSVKESSEPQRSGKTKVSEKFQDLWDKTYKKSRLFEAGFEVEELNAIFNRYNLSPQEVSWMVGRGIKKLEILDQYPIDEA